MIRSQTGKFTRVKTMIQLQTRQFTRVKNVIQSQTGKFTRVKTMIRSRTCQLTRSNIMVQHSSGIFHVETGRTVGRMGLIQRDFQLSRKRIGRITALPKRATQRLG